MGRKKNYIKIPVKPLLSAITAENKTVESVLRNINVNEDYVTDFPTDDLGKEINKDLNFLQLFNGLLCGKDIYEMLDVSDSLIRERVLERLAYLMGIDYQIIYYLWLNENK
jgi:hypothetical protein